MSTLLIVPHPYIRSLCFRDNNHGQLGIGSRIECHTPTVLQILVNVRFVACGESHSMAVTGTSAAVTIAYHPLAY